MDLAGDPSRREVQYSVGRPSRTPWIDAGAWIKEQQLTALFAKRTMAVTEHNYCRLQPGKGLLSPPAGCPAHPITVNQPYSIAAHMQQLYTSQALMQMRGVHIPRHRLHRSESLQLNKDTITDDVAGVKDQLHPPQPRKKFRRQKASARRYMRVRQHPDPADSPVILDPHLFFMIYYFPDHAATSRLLCTLFSSQPLFFLHQRI